MRGHSGSVWAVVIRIRLVVGVVTLLVVLSACGEATRAEFEQKQRSVDSLTRIVVDVVVKALDADPSSTPELGTAMPMQP